MSSLIRMLSIGKEKKQPPPVRDIEAFKRSISGPRALAPKHVIDKRIEAQKSKRIVDQERQRKVSSSPSMAQPIPAGTQRHRKASQATLKKHIKVEFAERPKALPATPTASTHKFDNPNTVTQKRENFLTITLDRKSVASSFWCCVGPDEQDSPDQTVVQTTQSNNVITESLQDGPVLIFRNEEERRQVRDVLATLRESLCDNEPADPSVPRCGRDCPQCLAQMHMVSRRKASECGGNMKNPTPQIVVRVIEDPEDATIQDQGYQRLSDADIEVFVIDELESRLYELSTQRQEVYEIVSIVLMQSIHEFPRPLIAAPISVYDPLDLSIISFFR